MDPKLHLHVAHGVAIAVWWGNECRRKGGVSEGRAEGGWVASGEGPRVKEEGLECTRVESERRAIQHMSRQH
eukprot:12525785-Alexandrium_andersonii.AAC.1